MSVKYYYNKDGKKWKIFSKELDGRYWATEWIATVTSESIAIALVDWLQGSHVLIEVEHKI